MRGGIRNIHEAVEKYRENHKELATIAHKQEKKIQFLETKAMHLAMFYVASQLIIFLTNSKPSSYQCKNWWKPFFISFSLAIGFGMNFFTTVIKYVRIKYAQEINYIDQNENYRQMSYLERNGHNHKEGVVNGSTSLEVDMSDTWSCHDQHHKPDMFTVYGWYVHIWTTGFVLLVFTILVLHTCWSSACARVA